jgi:hypothetical protein
MEAAITPTNNTYVTIEIRVPVTHFAVVERVANLFECKTEEVFQKALNHALKSGTLGHVLESMLNEKYKAVFDSPKNTHDLTL